jgi:hypothetical protein
MDADQRHAQAQHEIRQTSREDAPTAWRKKERGRRENDSESFTDPCRNQLFGNRIRSKCTAQDWQQPLVQVKPKEPTGCKLVGTVKGTKLWAGDCVASELRGTTPATETKPLSEQDIEAIPPGQKQ